MLIKENKELPEIVLGTLRKRVHYRSKWHLTDLLRCPRVTYWFVVGEKPVYSDSLLLKFTRGSAHHEILEVFPLKEIRRERDEIKMSIDMFGKRITEIYTTAISVNRIKTEEDVPKVFPNKVNQLMGYCYGCEETAGDLLVFHLFGDYSRFTETPVGLEYTGIQPELKSWTLYFEENELLDLWSFVLERKTLLEYCVAHKKVPEEKGEEWECFDCPYSYICPDAKRIDGVDVKKAKETLAVLERAVESLKDEGKI